jgi:hypothetical protein
LRFEFVALALDIGRAVAFWPFADRFDIARSISFELFSRAKSFIMNGYSWNLFSGRQFGFAAGAT